MNTTKLTAEDSVIMNRFDWVPFDSEHSQPSYQYAINDKSMSHTLVRISPQFPYAYIAVRDFYAQA